MKALAPVLARPHVAASVDVVATPAIASRGVPSRRRARSPESLLVLFLCGVLAAVAATTSLAGGGIVALVATITLVLVLTAVILAKTLSLLSGDGGQESGALCNRPLVAASRWSRVAAVAEAPVRVLLMSS